MCFFLYYYYYYFIFLSLLLRNNGHTFSLLLGPANTFTILEISSGVATPVIHSVLSRI